MFSNRLFLSSDLRVTSCGTALHNVASCDMLVSYLWRYKGGRCDPYGGAVTNRRGGCQVRAQRPLYCTSLVKKRDAERLQARRRNVAGKTVRPGRLYEESTRATSYFRGTLDSSLLAVPPVADTRPTCSDWNPIQDGLVDAYYLQILSRIWQGLATHANTCHMRTTSVGSVRPMKGNAMHASTLHDYPHDGPRCTECGKPVSSYAPAHGGISLCDFHLALRWQALQVRTLDSHYAQWQRAPKEEVQS